MKKVRIVIEHKQRDRISGYEGVSYETVVIESDELAHALTSGGFGEDMYSVKTVVGAEPAKES